MNKKFVDCLYEIKNTEGALIALTDSVDKATDIAKNCGEATSTELIKPVDYKYPDFFIIENDEEFDYGYSYAYWKEDTGMDVTTCKQRLRVDPDEDWETTLDEYLEDADQYWSDKHQTVNSAINAHLGWWMKANEALSDEEKVPMFALSGKQIKMLLLTGFEADRIVLLEGIS